MNIHELHIGKGFWGPFIKYVTLFWPIFTPPSPCHTLSHIPEPPKVRHTSRTPSRFLVGLVQKTRPKAPLYKTTNYLSNVRGGYCPGVLSGGLLSGWFLSVPPSVRMHLLQQKVKHHFTFHVSYVR